MSIDSRMRALIVLVVSSVMFLVAMIVTAVTLNFQVLGVGIFIYIASFVWCLIKFFDINLGTFAEISKSSKELASKVKKEKGVGMGSIFLSLMGPIMVTGLIVLIISIVTLLLL